MSRRIKNLSNKEEWIILDLSNMMHQVTIFLNEIEKVRDREKVDLKKLDWYQDVFVYYRDYLLPALNESADMEERHLDILKSNPDTGFSILDREVEYHQALYLEFSKRFEEVYKEFHAFVHRIY